MTTATITTAASATAATLSNLALAALAGALALALPVTLDLFGPPLALGVFA